jgi:glycosyltransferase involved in cell wall biosynthesis
MLWQLSAWCAVLYDRPFVNAATSARIRANAPITEDAARTFLAEHPGHGAPVVVIIPALNEAGSVGVVVKTVPPQLCGLDVDVLVVDDGSTDETTAEASGAGALVATLAKNTGQGNAFKLGYRLACERGATYIATADADGQFDPAELERLIELLIDDQADLVTGSRRLGEAHTTDSVRAWGVIVFGRIISILTGVRITDPANGLRAMRAEVAASVDLVQPQYQSSELLIRTIANGYRIKEVPVTMYKRESGTTKKGGNLAYGYRFSRVVFGTWWSSRAQAKKNVPSKQGLWF